MKPSPATFKDFRNPRRGESQADDMTNPFWLWCIETADTGYGNNEAFNGESSLSAGPCWSFDRFGQTETLLPDGSVVYIGGEHEDSYDPDFYIYNDVIVINPEGETTIYGYPVKDFPPTDNHSADLVDDEIILIGSLGYIDDREDATTQVLRINTKSWTVTLQPTTNSPGWISHHHTHYDPDEKIIRVTKLQRWTKDNGLLNDFSTWELNLNTWDWQCKEKKNWSQFGLNRKDGKMNNLWEIRQHIEMTEVGMTAPDMLDNLGDEIDEETKASILSDFENMHNENAALVQNTNLNLLPDLYRPSVPHTSIEPPECDFDYEEDDDAEDDFNHHIIEINRVTIRFIENSYEIIMRVEGKLPEDMLKYILDEVADKLAEFESTEYRYMKLPS